MFRLPFVVVVSLFCVSLKTSISVRWIRFLSDVKSEGLCYQKLFFIGDSADCFSGTGFFVLS